VISRGFFDRLPASPHSAILQLYLVFQRELNLLLILIALYLRARSAKEIVMRNLFQLPKTVVSWRKLGSEKGVTAIEYGILAALIALAIIGAVTLVGTNLSGTFNSIATQVAPPK
jgi:pilus assembly protein Flp/PilA